tara:strand:+ start:6456 stop:7760 length:1305 start_codon:yes stop_codon:yes gene_type:complete
MDVDVKSCLDNLDIKYDLNEKYINELFLLIRQMLKPLYKNYMLKKKTILKYIYDYFINIMNINQLVINISKLKQPVQRSQEWYDARYNKITASEIASVIGTDTSNISESELKKIYKKPAFKNSYELLKTKILKNDTFKGNIYTDWGILFEPIATLIYERRNNTHIIEFGLIEHPILEIIAASPDGITQHDATMIEIKAPYSRKLSGTVPLNYWIQMQLQMETCNLEKCDFVEVKTKLYSYEEFINDTNNNDEDLLLTKENLEKGLIIKCINDDKIDYYYPDYNIFRSLNQSVKWAEDRLNYYKTFYSNVEIIYWKLNEYSCIGVNRDKNWFNNTYYKFEEFWKKVTYFRNNMDEFLAMDKLKEDEKIKKKKKLNKEEFERSNVLTMLDSDSDTDTDTKLVEQETNIDNINNLCDSIDSITEPLNLDSLNIINDL